MTTEVGMGLLLRILVRCFKEGNAKMFSPCVDTFLQLFRPLGERWCAFSVGPALSPLATFGPTFLADRGARARGGLAEVTTPNLRRHLFVREALRGVSPVLQFGELRCAGRAGRSAAGRRGFRNLDQRGDRF